MAYGDDWEDPGWPPRVLLALIPFWANFTIAGRRKSRDALIALRTLYVALFMTPVYLLLVLVALSGGGATDPTLSPAMAGLLTAIAGAAGLFGSAMTRGKEVHLDAEQVVGAFRAVFFLRFALAESAVLVGFVMFFLGGGHLWIYLIGFVLGLAGFLLMAPTKGVINEWDRRRRGLTPRPSLGALLTNEE